LQAYTSIRVNSTIEKMTLEREIHHLKMTLASGKQHLKHNDSRISTNTNGSSSSLSTGDVHKPDTSSQKCSRSSSSPSSSSSLGSVRVKSAEHILVTASAEISDVDEVCMDQPLNSRQSKKIPRIHASNLTYEKYLEYASQTIPLIITGLRDEPNSPGLPDWSLENIYRLCGNKQVSLKRKIDKETNASIAMWAGIETVAETKLKEFIHDIVAKPRKRDGWPKDMADLYLHDMSIPKFCPELLKMYHVPRFFTYDLMQALSSTNQKDYWPSLFIGGKSTASSLHTDWGSTAAWMGLLKGRKHWVIAKPNQNALLYDQTQPYDPNNPRNEGIFASDLINPDLDKFPLLSQIDYYEDILHAGELIFIPADCPHQVQNLELVCFTHDD
jgi:hypothetical protein